MKTVWVIEEGECYDYHVVGVYSSEENARMVCDKINAGCEWVRAKVAEWDLDPGAEEIRSGMKVWSVRMAADGTVEWCEPIDLAAYALHGSVSAWKRSTAPHYRGTATSDAVMGTVFAKDREHAIKIVNEKRVQFLASGEIES